MLILLLLLAVFFLIKYLNRDYYLLAGCRRVKTADGSGLESKITIIPGKTIFGNNFDITGATCETAFKFAREIVRKGNGRHFLMHYASAPIYSVSTAEDAEEVFSSQALITKGMVYEVIKPFLGLGLLISTDEQWQFRRKLLTPAFHFNILQTFMEIFKEESHKFINVINQRVNEVVSLGDVIPQFTLNSVCETALGIKLDEVPGSKEYRDATQNLDPIVVKRMFNSVMYFPLVFACTSAFWKQRRLLRIAHNFSSKIIETKRIEFKAKGNTMLKEKVDEFGKKQRYAMLDTLLAAEAEGLIDHQGICDEVNTFMYEGFDTTSICLTFTMLNLAWHPSVQQKCYEEIQHLPNVDELTVFDFNKLEYLECVIKETLRLYPSVPFLARNTVKEIVVNGLILPPYTEVHIHAFDIMRDEKHFPDPNKFDPERFKPENTVNRHPFAFIPFSAGPRNCIGQKFAMLEMKVLLVSVLKNFKVEPVTRLEEITFENGIVLRTKEKLNVIYKPRNDTTK